MVDNELIEARIHPTWWRKCLLYGLAMGKDGTAVLYNRDYEMVATRPLNQPIVLHDLGEPEDGHRGQKWGGADWEEDWRIYFFFDDNPPWLVGDAHTRENILRRMREFKLHPRDILAKLYPNADHTKVRPSR